MANGKRRKIDVGKGYKRWTRFEERKLYELSNQGLSDVEIAILMERTHNSIVNRRYTLREKGEWDEKYK